MRYRLVLISLLIPMAVHGAALGAALDHFKNAAHLAKKPDAFSKSFAWNAMRSSCLEMNRDQILIPDSVAVETIEAALNANLKESISCLICIYENRKDLRRVKLRTGEPPVTGGSADPVEGSGYRGAILFSAALLSQRFQALRGQGPDEAPPTLLSLTRRSRNLKALLNAPASPGEPMESRLYQLFFQALSSCAQNPAATPLDQVIQEYCGAQLNSFAIAAFADPVGVSAGRLHELALSRYLYSPQILPRNLPAGSNYPDPLLSDVEAVSQGKVEITPYFRTKIGYTTDYGTTIENRDLINNLGSYSRTSLFDRSRSKIFPEWRDRIWAPINSIFQSHFEAQFLSETLNTPVWQIGVKHLTIRTPVLPQLDQTGFVIKFTLTPAAPNVQWIALRYNKPDRLKLSTRFHSQDRGQTFQPESDPSLARQLTYYANWNAKSPDERAYCDGFLGPSQPTSDWTIFQVKTGRPLTCRIFLQDPDGGVSGPEGMVLPRLDAIEALEIGPAFAKATLDPNNALSILDIGMATRLGSNGLLAYAAAVRNAASKGKWLLPDGDTEPGVAALTALVRLHQWTELKNLDLSEFGAAMPETSPDYRKVAYKERQDFIHFAAPGIARLAQKYYRKELERALTSYVLEKDVVRDVRDRLKEAVESLDHLMESDAMADLGDALDVLHLRKPTEALSRDALATYLLGAAQSIEQYFVASQKRMASICLAERLTRADFQPLLGTFLEDPVSPNFERVCKAFFRDLERARIDGGTNLHHKSAARDAIGDYR